MTRPILAALALAATLMLAGCFTSEKPLFAGRGDPMLGTGKVTVETHEEGQDPDGGVLMWTEKGYVDATDKEDGVFTFHHLPGTWPWSGWYVGQSTGEDKNGGYIYMLYRKEGARVLSYDVSCKDLSEQEAADAHLVRENGMLGPVCKAAQAGDLAKAFRILAKRTPTSGYWNVKAVK